MGGLVEPERSLAARVAMCVELLDVRLFGTAANLDNPGFEGSLSYTLDSSVSFQTVGEPTKSVIVTCEYEVIVSDSPESDDDGPADAEDDASTDDDDSSKVADIEFTLAALYAVRSSEAEDGAPFSDDEFEAFAATTGQFALYPYAREFISDITSRMGLPALHVGVFRIPLDSRTGD